MKLSSLLADIAYTGKRGVDPHTLRRGMEWDVLQLIALGLVHVASDARLVASVEKGYYPTMNSLGIVQNRWAA